MSRSLSSLPASAAAILRSSTEGESAVMTSLQTLGQRGGARSSQRWQPGFAKAEQHPCHSEIFASSTEGTGAALALALGRDALNAEAQGPLREADDQRHILWVQTRDAIKRGGRPYIHGLPDELRHRVIHVEAKDTADALFALEEGVRCCDLAFVIGEVLGNPSALDFTASRRLTLTAQRHGVRLYLVRIDAQRDLSSARMRWNVRSATSPRPRWDRQAPGIATWKAELFRARAHPPGEWTLYDDEGTLSISGPSIRIPRPANTPTNAPGIAPERTPKRTAHYGDMARPTVGRSLAAL